MDRLVQPKRDVRIYVDTERYIKDTRLQIYLQLEPEAINPKREYLKNNSSLYDVIFTFDADVLQHCANARRFTFYTQTWLQEKDYLSLDTSKKQFAISTVVGGKCMTEGHRIRQTFYFAQKAFASLPITFYRSCAQPHLPEIGNNPFLESKDIHAKSVLFSTYQFHLTIENSRQENYFTEKLIDCLITKTIPIYYGCPNIQEYFDTTGWILLESGDPFEFFSKCGELSSSYYEKYKDAIESNYRKAMVWKENLQRFNEALASVPGYL